MATELRACSDDRCHPVWPRDDQAECSQCGEPVYHDGTAWRHLPRTEV